MRTTVILGQNGLGKTTLARKMCAETGGCTSFLPRELSNINTLRMHDIDNIILVDGITIQDVPLLREIIGSNTITIQLPYIKSKVIPRPDLIIIAAEGITKSDFGDMDVFFIEMSKNKSVVSIPFKCPYMDDSCPFVDTMTATLDKDCRICDNNTNKE